MADSQSRTLVLGVGCRPGTSAEEIVLLARSALAEAGLDPNCVELVATIDRRRLEPGIVEAARQLGARLLSYDAEALAVVPDLLSSPSHAVRTVSATGVCEPAALLASDGGTLLVRKRRSSGATVAVAEQRAPKDSP